MKRLLQRIYAYFWQPRLNSEDVFIDYELVSTNKLLDHYRYSQISEDHKAQELVILRQRLGAIKKELSRRTDDFNLLIQEMNNNGNNN